MLVRPRVRLEGVVTFLLRMSMTKLKLVGQV